MQFKQEKLAVAALPVSESQLNYHLSHDQRSGPEQSSYVGVKAIPCWVECLDGPVGHQHSAVELEAAAKRQLPHALTRLHSRHALNVRQLIPDTAGTGTKQQRWMQSSHRIQDLNTEAVFLPAVPQGTPDGL